MKYKLDDLTAGPLEGCCGSSQEQDKWAELPRRSAQRQSGQQKQFRKMNKRAGRTSTCGSSRGWHRFWLDGCSSSGRLPRSWRDRWGQWRQQKPTESRWGEQQSMHLLRVGREARVELDTEFMSREQGKKIKTQDTCWIRQQETLVPSDSKRRTEETFADRGTSSVVGMMSNAATEKTSAASHRKKKRRWWFLEAGQYRRGIDPWRWWSFGVESLKHWKGSGTNEDLLSWN